jgi:hypothetical protein
MCKNMKSQLLAANRCNFACKQTQLRTQCSSEENGPKFIAENMENNKKKHMQSTLQHLK